jgi:hypothetical protein
MVISNLSSAPLNIPVNQVPVQTTRLGSPESFSHKEEKIKVRNFILSNPKQETDAKA